MKRGNLAALLHVLSFLVVLGVSVLTEPRLPIPKSVAKPLGLLTFLLGMAVFVWALVYLKGAFFGNVEPVSNRLVESGPYTVSDLEWGGLLRARLGAGASLCSPTGTATCCSWCR